MIRVDCNRADLEADSAKTDAAIAACKEEKESTLQVRLRCPLVLVCTSRRPELLSSAALPAVRVIVATANALAAAIPCYPALTLRVHPRTVVSSLTRLASQGIVEVEKQILLWEKKISLERETQETLDPDYGQGEISGTPPQPSLE